MLFMHRRFYKCSPTKMAARFSFDASKSLRRAAASFNKALEPTSMPVTLRAYARTAPGMLAAQF